MSAFLLSPQTANDFEPTHRIVMVKKIQRGDNAGMEELYQVFSKGMRFLICRQLGIQDYPDVMHEAFMIVVQAIRLGELRDPRCLMGYVRTVVRGQVRAAIEQRVQGRREDSDVKMGRTLADWRKTPEEHHQSLFGWMWLLPRSRVMHEFLGQLFVLGTPEHRIT